MRGARPGGRRERAAPHRREFEARRPVEILIQRKQRVGLQLPEDAAQLLFDPVDRVEKIATVDTEFARAQLPVGSQQKMVTEHAVLLAVQRAPGNETEIDRKSTRLNSSHVSESRMPSS